MNAYETRKAREREQEETMCREYERYTAWWTARRDQEGAGPLVCFDDWMRKVRAGKRPEQEFS